MTDFRDPLDPASFRAVLGHFPTGVTAVTCTTGDRPVGMAIGSFTSVSLDPPLVAFLPGKSSNSWVDIKEAGRFCVNVLSVDQLNVCSVMASKAEDKFADVSWHLSPGGSPIIDDAVAWIDCEIDAVHDAGDHEICVGRVLALECDAETEVSPLVFYRGGYGSFTLLPRD